MSEGGTIQPRIMLALSKLGARVFRNQVGFHKTQDGRGITYGLCPGSSDIIGWVPVTITPDMVGKRLAVFLACEVKAPKGRESDKQEKFREAVTAAGGIAGVARSDKEAVDLVASSVSLGQLLRDGAP